jgi:hypothetical protein
MTTHPLNQRGCDPFRIAHGFIRCHEEMQDSRMDPMEGVEIGPKRRAGPCTGRAVHFMSVLFVIIARPLVPAVADGGMARMAPPIALPLISREPRAARRKVLCDQGCAGARVGIVADPHALLPRLA